MTEDAASYTPPLSPPPPLHQVPSLTHSYRFHVGSVITAPLDQVGWLTMGKQRDTDFPESVHTHTQDTHTNAGHTCTRLRHVFEPGKRNLEENPSVVYTWGVFQGHSSSNNKSPRHQRHQRRQWHKHNAQSGVRQQGVQNKASSTELPLAAITNIWPAFNRAGHNHQLTVDNIRGSFILE